MEAHVLEFYCMEPTATVTSATSGKSSSGGIYGLMMNRFKPMSACSRDELEQALRHIVDTCRQKSKELCLARSEIADLQAMVQDLQAEVARK